MLSRIIERTGESTVVPLPLDAVGRPTDTRPLSNADVAALSGRIAELELQIVQTGAEAYARGRREGEAAAHERYSAAMQSTADRLAHSIKELADVRPKLCKQAEGDVIRLSLAIAKRILHREISIDPSALHALVQVCLERLGRQDEVRARVSPVLADSVRAILSKISARAIEVTAESTMEAGGLIFETSRGQLDASVHVQLVEIERGLIDHLEHRA